MRPKTAGGHRNSPLEGCGLGGSGDGVTGGGVMGGGGMTRGGAAAAGGGRVWVGRLVCTVGFGFGRRGSFRCRRGLAQCARRRRLAACAVCARGRVRSALGGRAAGTAGSGAAATGWSGGSAGPPPSPRAAPHARGP